MTPKQANYLIFTLTFCLAFLAWGTIIVMRQVNDVNYHAPTAEQQRTQAYQNCANTVGTNSGDCAKVTAGK